MFDLSKIFDFSRILHQFREIERVSQHPGSERRENDTEHSYDLAMLAWYLIDAYELPLNKGLVLQYALAHDIPEVYAGDSFFYSTDPKRDEKKAEKEGAARARLQREFPEFSDLHRTMEQYEARADAESRFVYALDKVQPIINIYLDGGRLWREYDVTIEKLVEKKKDKVAVSADVEKCFHELIALLRKDEQSLFGTTNDSKSTSS